MRAYLPVFFLLLASGCQRGSLQPVDGKGANLSQAAGRVNSSPGAGIDRKALSSSAAPIKDTRPLIVCFGDSLTAGYGTNAGESYPDYLQQDLNARGYKYRVLNEGISGNTSKDGVTRLQEAIALHPAVVIVAFGGNDGLRGLPIADTEMNLSTIIAAFKDAHAQVILGGITLPPNYGREYVARFDAMYRNLAKSYQVPLLPFMLQSVYGIPGDMQADGIHATARGNRQVAKNFLPLLLPVLHKNFRTG